jgi:hypothetical protein
MQCEIFKYSHVDVQGNRKDESTVILSKYYEMEVKIIGLFTQDQNSQEK